MADTQVQPQHDQQNSIAAWMLTLELARVRGDFERAAEAQRELRTRGVTVRYDAPQKERRVARAD